MALGRRARLLVKLAAAVAILAALVVFVDLGEVWAVLKTVKPVALLPLFAVFVADRLFMAYKWGILLRALDVRLGLWTLTRGYVYGSFTGTVLPTSIGGDVVRYCTLLDEPADRPAILATMVVEKLLGFLAIGGLAIYAAVSVASVLVEAGAATGTVVTVLAGGLAISGLAVAFVFLLRSPVWARLAERFGGRWREDARTVLDRLRELSGRRDTMVTYLLLTVVEQFAPVINIFILAWALGIVVPFSDLFAIVVLGLVVNRLPVSIAGLGLQEGALVSLFVLTGHSAEEGLALALGARLMDIVMPLPLFLAFFADAVRSLRSARRWSAEAR